MIVETSSNNNKLLLPPETVNTASYESFLGNELKSSLTKRKGDDKELRATCLIEQKVFKNTHTSNLCVPDEGKNNKNCINYWLSISFGRDSSNYEGYQSISASFGSVVLKKSIAHWNFKFKSMVIKETQNLNSKFEHWKSSSLLNVINSLTDSVREVRQQEFQTDDVISEVFKDSQFPTDILLITDGHFGLRNTFHNEIVLQSLEETISKTPFWWTYTEVGSLCSQILHQQEVKGLEQSLKALQIPHASLNTDRSIVTGIDLVVKLYLNKGFVLKCENIINSTYTPKIISENIKIPVGSVVEIRQLPWTATPTTLSVFFRGLNIIPGGIAIQILDGRRCNTAYVCFETAFEAQLACARSQQAVKTLSMNKHPRHVNDSSNMMHNNLVADSLQTISLNMQIALVNEELFLEHVVCYLPDVANFLSQLSNEKEIVVRMRGLPYSTKKSNIIEFFNEVHASVLGDENGIYFVNYPNDRPTGDAFILFQDNSMADIALTRHRNYLGQRYVELFKASPSEQIQVCQNLCKNRSPLKSPKSKLLKKMQSPKQSVGSISIDVFTPQATGHSGLTGRTDVLSHNLIDCLIGNNFDSFSALLTDSTDDTDGLNDPTHPKCPFVRPLPQTSGTIILQIIGMPLTISRHGMRLFLGPMIFSKILRLCKMVSGPLTGCWLLLISHTVETIQLIKKLIAKTQFKQNNAICPKFLLYEANNQGKLSLNYLNVEANTEHSNNIFSDSFVAINNENFKNNSFLQNHMTLPSVVFPPAITQFASLFGETKIFNCNSPNFAQLIQLSKLLQLRKNDIVIPNLSLINTPACFNNFNNIFTYQDCILQLIGVPQNVTSFELMSLCAPVAQLCSIPPQFVPYEIQTNTGQCSFLVIFGNPVDAEMVLLNCPIGSLRNNTFITIMSRLSGDEQVVPTAQRLL